ncbi:hypothetical protein MASR2M15_27550 [Anaerolineales bacterium]
MQWVKTISEWAKPVLIFPYVLQTRRNHALEHATIHLLSRRYRNLSGRSSENGFIMFGNVPEAQVETATKEALKRLKAGESQWAIHPNCGTNLLTTAFLVTLSGAVGFYGSSFTSLPKRFTWVMILMMLALLYSPFLGADLQKYITTAADMGDTKLISVRRHEFKIPILNRQIVLTHVHTQA